MKHTVNDAVRMTGQLLLHHPTTGYWARLVDGYAVHPKHPDATCWCLAGACFVVAHVLGLNQEHVKTAAAQTLGLRGEWVTDVLMIAWESPHVTDDNRQHIASKLAKVTAE
jgi:hypothetical protein